MNARVAVPGALLSLLLGGAPACKRAAQESRETARSASSASALQTDPHADGKRLAAHTAQLPARWTDVQLPSCEKLLNETEAQQRCGAVLPAIERLRAALERNTEADAIVPLLADLALAAELATQALRDRGVEQLFETRPTSPVSPSGSGSASARWIPSGPSSALGRSSASKPRAAATHPGTPSRPPAQHAPERHAHDAHDRHAHGVERQHDNPVLDAITEYRRIATVALRQLGYYLEYGPLAVRRRSLREIERLAQARSRWGDLKNLVREAELVEPAPELKRELHALRERLG